MEEWLFGSPYSTVLEIVSPSESLYVIFAFIFINYLSARKALEVKSFLVFLNFFPR